MKQVLWWLRHNPDGLEQAKRDDAEATMRLQETTETAAWARRALKSNGFADALILIMRGETS